MTDTRVICSACAAKFLRRFQSVASKPIKEERKVMPYRFHPTKRGLYKLVAEKAAELSWLELPKSSEMLFEHGKHSAWLRWPYYEIYFTPSPYPLLAVEQYGDAPSDEAKCVRQRKVFNFSLADLQAYGLIKEVPSKESCL